MSLYSLIGTASHMITKEDAWSASGLSLGSCRTEACSIEKLRLEYLKMERLLHKQRVLAISLGYDKSEPSQLQTDIDRAQLTLTRLRKHIVKRTSALYGVKPTLWEQLFALFVEGVMEVEEVVKLKGDVKAWKACLEAYKLSPEECMRTLLQSSLGKEYFACWTPGSIPLDEKSDACFVP